MERRRARAGHVQTLEAVEHVHQVEQGRVRVRERVVARVVRRERRRPLLAPHERGEEPRAERRR